MTANTLEKERQREGVIRNRDVVPGGKVKGAEEKQKTGDSSSAGCVTISRRDSTLDSGKLERCECLIIGRMFLREV